MGTSQLTLHSCEPLFRKKITTYESVAEFFLIEFPFCALVGFSKLDSELRMTIELVFILVLLVLSRLEKNL